MKVLLLVQAPCTAGTYITKYLCAHLSPDCLIAESNPWWITQLDSSSFLPLYPCSLPIVSRFLNISESLKVFSAALDELFRVLECKSYDFVVIRDHMFSEFFLAASVRERDAGVLPFWVDYLISRAIDYKVVFSARHPFDSYLGLCHSFPEHARSFTLESYSSCYLSALSAFKVVDRVSFLSIEALAQYGLCHPVLADLRAWRGLRELNPTAVKALSAWESSGASGRSNDQPTIFQRRQYVSSLRKQVLASSSFSILCHELGYDSDLAYFSSRAAILSGSVSDLLSWLFRVPLLPRLLRLIGVQKPVTQP